MYKYQPIFQVVYCLLNHTWSHKHFPSVLIQHFQENLCHTGYKFKTSGRLISRIIIPENQFSTLIGSPAAYCHVIGMCPCGCTITATYIKLNTTCRFCIIYVYVNCSACLFHCSGKISGILILL